MIDLVIALLLLLIALWLVEVNNPMTPPTPGKVLIRLALALALGAVLLRLAHLI